MSNALSSLFVEFRAGTKAFAGDMKDVAKEVRQLDAILKPIKQRAEDVGKVLTAGLTIPLVGLGGAAVAAALKMDEAMDTIRSETGATGKSLEAMGKSFKTVLGAVPNSIEDVTTAISELTRRTGLAGKPLEDLATQELNLSRITKSSIGETVALTTRVFGDWGVATEKQGKTLDYLFAVSQNTGAGVNALAASVVQFGAPLRQMGFSFETSAALLGKFEKEGVNAELVMGSLRIALTKMAKAGITDAAAGLAEIQKRIMEAGTAAKANSIAVAAFGSKAGPDMAAAIREGRFAIGDLVKQLEGSRDSINKAAADTLSFADKLKVLKNQATLALEPIGTRMLEALEKMMPALTTVLGGVASLANAFAGLPEPVQLAIIGLAVLLAGVGPVTVAVTKLSGTFVGIFGLLMKGIPLITSAATVLVSLGVGTVAVVAGVVALGAGIGVVLGMFGNWLIKVTGLTSVLDNFLKTVVGGIPIIGKWLTGQDAIVQSTKWTGEATKDLTAALTKRNIVFDAARLGDSQYVAGLGKQMGAADLAAAKTKAQAEATKGLGGAVKTTTTDIAGMAKLLGETSKTGGDGLKALLKSFEEAAHPANALGKEITLLVKEHKNLHDIAQALSDKIVQSVEAQMLLGEKIPLTVSSLYAEAKAFEEVKRRADKVQQLAQQFDDTANAAKDLFGAMDQLKSVRQIGDPAMVERFGSEIIRVTEAAVRNRDTVVANGKTIIDHGVIVDAQTAKLYKDAVAWETVGLAMERSKKKFADAAAGPEILRLEIELATITLQDHEAVLDTVGPHVLSVVDAYIRLGHTHDELVAKFGKTTTATYDELKAQQLLADGFESYYQMTAGVELTRTAMKAFLVATGDTAAAMGIYGDKLLSALDAQIALRGSLDATTELERENITATLALVAVHAELFHAAANVSILADEMARLSLEGKTDEEIFAVLGERFISAANAAEDMGLPISEDARKLRELAETADMVSGAMTQLGKDARFPGEVAAAFEAMRVAGKSDADIVRVLGGEIDQATDMLVDMGSELDANTAAQLRHIQGVKNSVDAAKEFRAAWGNALGGVTDKLADGFTDVILRTKKAKDVLVGIAMDTGKSFINAFFKQLLSPVKGFLTQLGTSLAGGLQKILGGIGGGTTGGAGGIINSLTGGASSIISKALGLGGTVAGGAATATIGGGTAAAGTAAAGTAGTTAGMGSTLAGLASNPITIAVAAGLATVLIAKNYIGKGRRTADEFVKEAQNPFGADLAATLKAYNRTKEQGTATAKSTLEVKYAIQDMYDSFEEAKNKFAAQGKTEKKVAGQAQTTLDADFGKDLSIVFAGLDKDIATLKKPAVSGTAIGDGVVAPFGNAVDLFRKAVQSFATLGTEAVAKPEPIPSLGLGGFLRMGGLLRGHAGEVVMPLSDLKRFAVKLAGKDVKPVGDKQGFFERFLEQARQPERVLPGVAPKPSTDVSSAVSFAYNIEVGANAAKTPGPWLADLKKALQHNQEEISTAILKMIANQKQALVTSG